MCVLTYPPIPTPLGCAESRGAADYGRPRDSNPPGGHLWGWVTLTYPSPLDRFPTLYRGWGAAYEQAWGPGGRFVASIPTSLAGGWRGLTLWAAAYVGGEGTALGLAPGTGLVPLLAGQHAFSPDCLSAVGFEMWREVGSNLSLDLDRSSASAHCRK